MDGKPRWAAPTVGVTPVLRRLWRTIGPGALDPSLAERLLAAVAAARPGPTREDGLRMVREARIALSRGGLPSPDTDVAATVILACALRGNASAARFLADALDRLAVSEGGGMHHARFAKEWRALSRRPPGTGAAGNDAKSCFADLNDPTEG